MRSLSKWNTNICRKNALMFIACYAIFLPILFSKYVKKQQLQANAGRMDLTSNHTEHSLESASKSFQTEQRGNGMKGQFLIPPIPDRMYPTVIELLPDEIMTIPVWDSNHTLVSGGKEIERWTCAYPILDSSSHETIGRCCLGAKSAGGAQVYKGAEETCPQDLPIYRQIQDYALQELEAYPVQHEHHPRNWTLTKCDVCRMVQIVASMKHKRIAIAGDSVQRQLFHGFECELRRRNFEVSVPVDKSWPRPRENEDWNQSGWKYGMRGQTCFNVTVPQWMNYSQHPQQYSLSPYVEICMYDHYRPYLDMIQHVAIANQSDIMMINYGPHYLPGVKEFTIEFELSIKNLLHIMNSSECHLMYRETAAQHFNSNGGEFEMRMHTGVNVSCQAIRGPIMKWRKDIFERIAEESGYSIIDVIQPMRANTAKRVQDRKKEVAFIPFFDYTSKMLTLHDRVDCTHFCYTPHLWYPIWRHMRIAMDQLDSF